MGDETAFSAVTLPVDERPHPTSFRAPSDGVVFPWIRRGRLALERSNRLTDPSRGPRLRLDGARDQSVARDKSQRARLLKSQYVGHRHTYGAPVTTDGVLHPAGSSYGAWPLIAGTLQTSAIALIIALPIALGTAFALTERLPQWLSRPISFFVEVLAGIPSVIIGLWGVLTLGPLLAKHVYPFISNNMPNVPVLRYFKGNVGYGEGLLTSGLVLGL